MGAVVLLLVEVQQLLLLLLPQTDGSLLFQGAEMVDGVDLCQLLLRGAAEEEAIGEANRTAHPRWVEAGEVLVGIATMTLGGSHHPEENHRHHPGDPGVVGAEDVVVPGLRGHVALREEIRDMIDIYKCFKYCSVTIALSMIFNLVYVVSSVKQKNKIQRESAR